jgi:hypothetical protein
MQVDVVSPHCAAASPFYDDILRARGQFDLQFPVKPYERQSPRFSIPVRVRGLGFFHTSYGWRTFRLAPVLDLQFNPPDFNPGKVVATSPAVPQAPPTAQAPSEDAGAVPTAPVRRSSGAKGLAVVGVFIVLAGVAALLVRR